MTSIYMLYCHVFYGNKKLTKQKERRTKTCKRPELQPLGMYGCRVCIFFAKKGRKKKLKHKANRKKKNTNLTTERTEGKCKWVCLHTKIGCRCSVDLVQWFATCGP